MKHINKKFALKWTKVDMVGKYISKFDLMNMDLNGRFYWVVKPSYVGHKNHGDGRYAYFEDPNTAAFIVMKYSKPKEQW